MRTCETGELPS